MRLFFAIIVFGFRGIVWLIEFAMFLVIAAAALAICYYLIPFGWGLRHGEWKFIGWAIIAACIIFVIFPALVSGLRYLPLMPLRPGFKPGTGAIASPWKLRRLNILKGR